MELVIDVRTLPRSRANPQYNFDVMASELEPFQMAYARIPELGGLRSRSNTISPHVNGFWKNKSFHNYADYALSNEFDLGLVSLMELAATRRATIMCAEAVWWRCHRRIIADYLLLHGRRVVHLMGKGRSENAVMTKAARELEGHLIYPAPTSIVDEPGLRCA